MSKKISGATSGSITKTNFWIVYLLFAALWGGLYSTEDIKDGAPSMRKYLEESLYDEYAKLSYVYDLIKDGLEEISKTCLGANAQVDFSKTKSGLISVYNAGIRLWNALSKRDSNDKLDVDIPGDTDDITRAAITAFEDMYNFDLEQ